MSMNEPNLFKEAVQAGDTGLIGVDGSGNDPEFSQDLGNLAVNQLLEEDEQS